MNPTFGIAPETRFFAASPIIWAELIPKLSLESQNVRTRRSCFSSGLRLDLGR